MDDLAEDIMTRKIISIHPDNDIIMAFELMKKFDIRHLPVIERKTSKLVGILSEGDILLFSQKNSQGLEISKDIMAQQAMSKNVVYCYPSSHIANIAATMITAKIDSIPVLDSDTHKLVGIVTTTDVLDQLCMFEELNGHNVRPFKHNKSETRQYKDAQGTG